MDIAVDWAEIVLNFFIEKHGKAVVDGHFGMIVFWIKHWITVIKKRLLTNADVKSAIEKGWLSTCLRNGDSPPVYVLEYGETDSPAVHRHALDCFSQAKMKRSYCFRWQSDAPNSSENFGVGGLIGSETMTPNRFDLPRSEVPKEDEEGEDDEDVEEDGQEVEEGEEGDDEGEEEEGEELDPQARFTKWARDVAPEAQTDFGQQRRTHQFLRKL